MASQMTTSEKRTNKILGIIAWIFVGIGVLVLGWFYLFASSHVNTNNAQVRQYITPVSSKVSGFIQEVRFEENQFVHKGDTLVVIDNREFANQVQMAEATLESTAESVDSYQSAVSVKSSDLQTIQANIEASKIEVWRTEQEYQRFKNLVEEEAATIQQFENVEAKFKQAQAHLKALQNQYTTAKINAAAEQTKVAPVRSQVAQQKAHLNNTKLILSYTYVVAPYEGWVGVKNIQVGQLIKEGQALVQVVSKEKWVVANFKETQLGEIDTTKEIEIHADAFPNIVFKGKVQSLSPAAGSEFSLIKPDNSTGNFVKIEQRFPVKIVLEESTDLDKLRTGMNVTVSAQKID
ncbi:HlyD family secretion protein [Sphingobacterium sp. SGL-16]|uniref:HlyD family secretion protein n=1 Tax=Sphingobacterium sp. SGL-16 TaxID=2710883 RepID=UPI0013EC7E71|nr:HlyD family secretion protein [Sphingobacterium sp. SGL-16]NGM74241.1 HlyD family secretion protein [Sphingobacterium sp. SGL-16]